MLVRNNIKCPHCGKYAAMDIYVPDQLPVFPSGLVLRAECYECLAFKDTLVDWSVLHSWLRQLSHDGTCLSASYTLPRRWSPSWFLSKTENQKRAILRQCLLWFSGGVCLLEFVDSPTLCGIYRMLETSGDHIAAHCRHAWSRL